MHAALFPNLIVKDATHKQKPFTLKDKRSIRYERYKLQTKIGEVDIYTSDLNMRLLLSSCT